MADDEATLLLQRRARRRLIGAIAVVLALVIVPPWVMDLEPKPVVTDLTVEIPQQESAAPLPSSLGPTADAPQSTSPERREAPRGADAALEAKRAPTTESVEVVPASPTADAPRGDAAAEAKRAEAILSGEAYVVPLGAYASSENVKQLASKLAHAGVKHYTETVATSSGEQTRVRAGPFTTKALADTTRDKLKSLGFDPGPVTTR